MEQLELEQTTYRQLLPTLAADEGKFVLIKGSVIVGVWNTLEEALTEGYRVYGVDAPFLVKRIQQHEAPVFASRFWEPACLP